MRFKFLILTLVLVFAVVEGAAVAQERDPRDRTITVDDFSLTFHRVIVRNANITEYAGDPPTQGPGFSDAPHFAVTLYNEPGTPEEPVANIANIRIYNVSDLQDYPFLAKQADALGSLLDEQPDLGLFQTLEAVENNDQLPYVPVLPHGQLLRARAQYVETDEVRGISYIFASPAAREPFMNNAFAYTFQGLSADGEYYISATMPLETTLFPAELEGFDPVAFEEEWPAYLEESIATLNDALPEDFEPALGVLDGLVQTFAFVD